MGILGLRNYRVDELEEAHVTNLQAIFASHDNPADGPCELCGKDCWGRVCHWCKNACDHSANIRGYRIVSSGVASAVERCLTCGRMGRGIPRGETILNVCVRNNLERHDVPPCSRCGSNSGTEIHHWAPRAVFNDADLWPMSPLCVTCHRTWHNAMRAARGVSLPENRRIGDKPWSAA